MLEFHLDYVTLRNITSLRHSRCEAMFSGVVEDNTRGAEWRGCKQCSTFSVLFQIIHSCEICFFRLKCFIFITSITNDKII